MSTGFNFGANPSAPGFGQTAFGAQPPGSITFGTPVSAAVGNTSFGQSASSGFGSTSFSGFGMQAAQQQNPLNQPVVGTATGATNFGFGAPTTTNTGFGFGTTPTVSTATTQQPAGFGFGAAATPQQPSGFSFGAAQQPTCTAPSTGFGFGASAVTKPATGFGFGGATGTTGTAASTAGLSFGAAVPTTTATGFNFGAGVPATGTVAQPTFNLGGLTTTPGTSTGLSFGLTAPTSTGLGLGSTIQPLGGGLNFGIGTAPTSTGVTGLGGLFGPTTSSVGGLSLGTTLATTQPLGMNFGTNVTSAMPSLSFATTTAATPGGLGAGGFNFGGSFGLGGTPATTLNFTKPTTTTAQPIGLGGIVQSTPKTSTTTSKTETLPRDELLPNELQQTVDAFKNYVKQQKGYSSDVARCSVKEFKKVATELDTTSNLLNDVEKQLQTNRAVADKLKTDTARGLQFIEMAQRTFDTPPGLQYDNTAPIEFFIDLVDRFERDMHTLKMQIENADKYVRNIGKPSMLSSEDLAIGMRRLHESFVALAGRLQSVHTQVQSQKEQYLNLRRYMLHDDTNVFEKPAVPADALKVAIHTVSYKPPEMASGPTPFSSFTHPSIIQAAVSQSQSPQVPGLALQAPQPSLFSTATQPIAGGLFANTPLSTTFSQQPQLLFGSATTNFQLQKPPTGNKRSK